MRIPVSVAAVGAGLVLLLSSCGSSSSASSAATGASTATTVASTPAGGSTASSTANSGGGGQGRAQLQAYRDCLSQHGVTLPSLPANAGSRPVNTGSAPDGSGGGGQGPGGGGRGGFGGLTSVLQDPANASAVQACASLAPAFGAGGGGGGRNSQAFQAYLQCLADNGVAVPTTVQGGPRASVDRNDPKFAAANTKCQVLLPQRTGNGDGSNPAAGSTVAGSATSTGN